jgi:hypothetical protein
VVWFDRPWFGESPADILNFFNSGFHFKLNDQVLNRLAPKAFEFAEIFQTSEFKSFAPIGQQMSQSCAESF